MRILLLNQFFWPDSAATSQLLTDLARGLKERGHDVHAICGGGGYATADGSADDPRVTIHRVIRDSSRSCNYAHHTSIAFARRYRYQDFAGK
jgi:hypothetical protein